VDQSLAGTLWTALEKDLGGEKRQSSHAERKGPAVAPSLRKAQVRREPLDSHRMNRHQRQQRQHKRPTQVASSTRRVRERLCHTCILSATPSCQLPR
jgi:hypothetical protein